ncbi:helix-turn-helix domain-containing protein [Acidianus manzaensis]|uniref:Bacterio-opsin activator n=1 Tax=Acidianus manzaensis TaxID=282676 RepID=A0A1W6JZ18_9CREN|nr:helix-turn-helix domain-containing protein [Acidianus manzaensis]ARM75516.1 bacterio-opsin activator [Acidianus manzaensis]
MLKKAYITVEHEDCWTLHMPYDAYTVNLEVYPHKNYLRSRILVDTRDKEILNRMKSHHSILKVLNAYKFRDSLYVDFLNEYKGSIAGLLYDKEVLILGNTISNNRETWSFVTNSKNIREILKELESIGKITDIQISDFNLFLSPKLTKTETRVLGMAYEYGYLDYPRRISADEMAEKLGLSKVTFLYHLRNAQKKLTKFVIKNNTL